MTTLLNKRVADIKPPMTREMTRLGNELAAAGRSIMSLAQGEPDFDTPPTCARPGKAAIDAGQTRYTDIPGSRALTEAIIRKFQRDNGLSFKPNEVTIGVGSKQVLYNALQATVGAGDEVAIAIPAWVSYVEMVRMTEAEPVLLPATAKTGFKITPAQLEAAITRAPSG
jgi:aspartate aminotransferase